MGLLHQPSAWSQIKDEALPILREIQLRGLRTKQDRDAAFERLYEPLRQMIGYIASSLCPGLQIVDREDLESSVLIGIYTDCLPKLKTSFARDQMASFLCKGVELECKAFLSNLEERLPDSHEFEHIPSPSILHLVERMCDLRTLRKEVQRRVDTYTRKWSRPRSLTRLVERMLWTEVLGSYQRNGDFDGSFGGSPSDDFARLVFVEGGSI